MITMAARHINTIPPTTRGQRLGCFMTQHHSSRLRPPPLCKKSPAPLWYHRLGSRPVPLAWPLSPRDNTHEAHSQPNYHLSVVRCLRGARINQLSTNGVPNALVHLKLRGIYPLTWHTRLKEGFRC